MDCPSCSFFFEKLESECPHCGRAIRYDALGRIIGPLGKSEYPPEVTLKLSLDSNRVAQPPMEKSGWDTRVRCPCGVFLSATDPYCLSCGTPIANLRNPIGHDYTSFKSQQNAKIKPPLDKYDAVFVRVPSNPHVNSIAEQIDPMLPEKTIANSLTKTDTLSDNPEPTSCRLSASVTTTDKLFCSKSNGLQRAYGSESNRPQAANRKQKIGAMIILRVLSNHENALKTGNTGKTRHQFYEFVLVGVREGRAPVDLKTSKPFALINPGIATKEADALLMKFRRHAISLKLSESPRRSDDPWYAFDYRPRPGSQLRYRISAAEITGD